MTLLEVRDLGVRFRGSREVIAAEGVSFTLDRGETLAIVGESGSGKSVTALSIPQLLPYPKAYHPKGSIRFEGTEMIGAREDLLLTLRGKRIGMIFQEPLSSLNPLHSIERQIGEVLQLHEGLSGAALRRRILDLLHEVRIKEPEMRLQSFPHQLSGGQRQRVMIAMAIACKPDLLIADEPTTALDVTVQAAILKLLGELQAAMGMAILLVSHDLAVVRKLANRVAVMRHGQIVEQGQIRDVMEAPQHPYTQQLMAAEPKGPPAPSRLDAPILIRTEGISVDFPIGGGWFSKPKRVVAAVRHVSIDVPEGTTLGVVGESGSGKTTLGLALLRLVASKGPIVVASERIDHLARDEMRRLRRKLQIVFQDPFGSLSPRLSVGEIVGEGLLIHRIGMNEEERRQRVTAALSEVGLDPEAMERYPHEFSGGQRQRIGIARALILDPVFVVLDEPTSALDVSIQVQIVDLLKRLQVQRNLTFMFISHDLRVVRAVAHQVVVMKDGLVVEAGPTERVMTRPEHPYTRALLRAAVDLEPVD
ncbi:MAG TPA: ABC transporter ATP-binding protein [Geminicoccus sp.]|jgi:microcin C transport system ATP-binding protein|uniref:ABC transporter ATP-binding protein n=1 Tax=Geminicoccus sp. TaxID=2024832 RepID=UPI002E350A60|nr:ABC transporter ATP-binding protein [Geminicoccus sp.]HEX2529382.1 ABC transporter ATP-binding protein [Geminicoccus sp.]